MTQDTPINERIRAHSVRIVESDGRQSGIIPIQEALRRARNAGLDLVQIAKGDVPVCKYLDADRHRFEMAKAAREQARKQREMQIVTKEIQLRPVTDDNDIAVKSRRAREFLSHGDKVKVVVRFKGRERTHREQGLLVMEQFLGMVGEHKVDSPLAQGERDMVIILGPTVTKSELLRARNAGQAAAE